MIDLERRALLGDAEAQRECTEKGIVLICPRCGKGGASTKYVMGDYWYECPHCHSASGFHSSAEVALSDWNTRPASPLGRCWECEKSPDIGTKTKGMRWCRRFRAEVKPDGYCDGFRPKGA